MALKEKSQSNIILGIKEKLKLKILV
jgi:hypothetical protein